MDEGRNGDDNNASSGQQLPSQDDVVMKITAQTARLSDTGPNSRSEDDNKAADEKQREKGDKQAQSSAQSQPSADNAMKSRVDGHCSPHHTRAYSDISPILNDSEITTVAAGCLSTDGLHGRSESEPRKFRR